MKTQLKSIPASWKNSKNNIERITYAVNAQMEDNLLEYASDIANHGIDGGYSGFIYYSETHAFAMKNRKMIVELLEDQAFHLGEEVTAMVANFKVFRGSPMDSDDRRDLYKYLGGDKPDQGTITNIMAWFAAEEAARFIDNEYEQDED